MTTRDHATHNTKTNQFTYPSTKREFVREFIHGVEIIDPYRWLENLNDPNVREWIKEQNALTRKILDNLPSRKTIEKRLIEIFPRGVMNAPLEKKLGWFYLRREKGENQVKLCFNPKNHSKQEIVLVNPNELDPEGLTTIDWFFPNDDGTLVAYGLSHGGDEWSTLHVLDVRTGRKLAEAIPRTRFCTVRWKKDNSGFYYTKYPEIGEVPSGEEFYHKHVRFHELESPHEDDPIIFKNERHPRDFPIPYLSPDESYMLVLSSRFVAADLYYIDLTTNPPTATPIVEDNTWMIKSIKITGDHVYLLAAKDSPNYMLYRTTKDQLDPNKWEIVISPPENGILVDFKIIKEKIAVVLQQEVSHHVIIHEMNGDRIYEVPLPSLGTITELKGHHDSTKISFIYHSFFHPIQSFVYDVTTKQLEEFDNPSIQVDASRFEITRTWYKSKDGTKVHMYIYHRKDLKKNGQNPTILYGYGGFGISLLPSFSPHFYFWVEQGGIVAIANLRGGNEFGEAWHDAGRLDKKQNVFDDFIAAAEYLIAEKYCSPQTLGIAGGSNGGLLVGAAMTQRPDLFAAVYCGVPLLDMIRYHKFSMAKAWIPEYGDPDNPEHFQWLYAYSPYHHVKKDESYPAVLFHAAEADSRVDPSHAIKMAARMQYVSAAKENPILLYMESAAGHGVGKPVSKRVQQFVDMIAFFAWRLGLTIND